MVTAGSNSKTMDRLVQGLWWIAYHCYACIMDAERYKQTCISFHMSVLGQAIRRKNEIQELIGTSGSWKTTCIMEKFNRLGSTSFIFLFATFVHLSCNRYLRHLAHLYCFHSSWWSIHTHGITIQKVRCATGAPFCMQGLLVDNNFFHRGYGADTGERITDCVESGIICHDLYGPRSSRSMRTLQRLDPSRCFFAVLRDSFLSSSAWRWWIM